MQRGRRAPARATRWGNLHSTRIAAQWYLWVEAAGLRREKRRGGAKRWARRKRTVTVEHGKLWDRNTRNSIIPSIIDTHHHQSSSGPGARLVRACRPGEREECHPHPHPSSSIVAVSLHDESWVDGRRSPWLAWDSRDIIQVQDHRRRTTRAGTEYCSLLRYHTWHIGQVFVQVQRTN